MPLTGAHVPSTSKCGGTTTQLSSADKDRVITDRFAPPSADAPALSSGLPSDYACVAGSRAYCGGNWRSIIDKLDYIQAMGFDAIWISPISSEFKAAETSSL